ncbi:MAG: hypothetical protein AAB465_00895 [Patescibacteria group bacterium]
MEIRKSPNTKSVGAYFILLDPVTGLIVAAALVLPDKKISVLTPDNVLNRFKEKGFARGANREHISACSELDLTLEQFVALSLSAMQKISVEIGL